MKDDRGDLDLTKQIEQLQLTIKMYQSILRDAQKQIYYWKTFWYESQSKENLLQGYKKVIEELTERKIGYRYPNIVANIEKNAGQLDWAHKTQVELLRKVRENDVNEYRIQLMQSMNCISAGLGWTG